MKNNLFAGVMMFALMGVALVSPIASVQAEETATPVAVTTSVNESSKIAELMAQLAKLTELFNSLKAQMMGTKAEIKELRADIKEGMTSDDVKAIQEMLASDSSIYPRGLVTGYFGPMTKEAIKRFQEKNGLEVTGEVNEETRAAMDTIIAERKAAGKFPVGLMLNKDQKEKFMERVGKRCVNAAADSQAAKVCAEVKARHEMKEMKKPEDKKMTDDSTDTEDDDTEDADDDTEDENDDSNDSN